MTNERCPSCFETDYWDPARQECRFCGWSPDVTLDEGAGWSDLGPVDEEPEGEVDWG